MPPLFHIKWDNIIILTWIWRHHLPNKFRYHDKKIYTAFWKTTNNLKCYTVRSNDFPWMDPYRHLRGIGFKFQIRIATVHFTGLAIRVTFLMTLEGRDWPWVLGTLIYEGIKLERGGRVVPFIFSLSFHHVNDRFENICIFSLPLFNSVAKKCFLRLNNYWRRFFSLSSTNSRLWDKQMLVNKGV